MLGLRLSLSVVATLLCGSAFAYESKLGLDYYTLSPYDIIVPSLNGAPSGADRQVGQLFLDVSTGSTGTLKLVTNDGNIVSLSSGTGSPVTSSNGSNERIERAKITVSGSTVSTTYESGDWLPSTHTYNGTGWYNISFNSGLFSASAQPSCVITPVTATQIRINGGTSSTGITNLNFYNAAGVAVDTDFYVICMGAKP